MFEVKFWSRKVWSDSEKTAINLGNVKEMSGFWFQSANLFDATIFPLTLPTDCSTRFSSKKLAKTNKAEPWNCTKVCHTFSMLRAIFIDLHNPIQISQKVCTLGVVGWKSKTTGYDSVSTVLTSLIVKLEKMNAGHEVLSPLNRASISSSGRCLSHRNYCRTSWSSKKTCCRISQ